MGCVAPVSGIHSSAFGFIEIKCSERFRDHATLIVVVKMFPVAKSIGKDLWHITVFVEIYGKDLPEFGGVEYCALN